MTDPDDPTTDDEPTTDADPAAGDDAAENDAQDPEERPTPPPEESPTESPSMDEPPAEEDFTGFETGNGPDGYNDNDNDNDSPVPAAEADGGETQAGVVDDADGELNRFSRFIENYCEDELSALYNGYPHDKKALNVSWQDLHRFDRDLSLDMIDAPGNNSSAEVRKQVIADIRDAIFRYDAPIDVDITDAEIRIHDLPDEATFYPGRYSPSDNAGEYRTLRGEITKATDVFPQLEDGAYECQRCGTLTRTKGREPHECQGCERQGPYVLNQEESVFVDAQHFRLQTPAEVAGGTGKSIDVRVENDLAGYAQVGDTVAATGTLELEPRNKDDPKNTRYDPYLDGTFIELEETTQQDLDITPEMREEVQALAAGERGDPMEVAGDSLAPGIFGHDLEKQMLILAMVAGSRKEKPSGEKIRGEFHILLIGDPSTGKSQLIDRVEDIGWRAVGVSGKGATEVGLTASVVQDDLGDTDRSLEAGAFVKANRGIVCIDELDDMDPNIRAAMLEPMSKQTIHVNKYGINAVMNTRTAVAASANPKHGRFDPYEPIIQQIDLDGALLSRFDLVFTFTDEPDADEDEKLADHTLRSHDAAKRRERGMEISDEDAETIDPPVDKETLRAWIGMAKRQPKPVFESDEVREAFKEKYKALRGIYDYDSDQPVPVTLRKLEATVRVAEAAAKFHFSDVITERHAEIAMQAVGQSMQDFGTDEDGNLDADMHETGQSASQRERRREIIPDAFRDLQDRMDGPIPFEVLLEDLEGISESQLSHDLQHLADHGVIYSPQANNEWKFMGWSQ